VNVLLVPAHPGFPGQIPQSRKTVVVLCVNKVPVVRIYAQCLAKSETNCILPCDAILAWY